MGGLTFHPALTGEVRFIFGRAVITHGALGALLYFKKMGEAFCVVVFGFISRLFLICFVLLDGVQGNKVEEFPKPISTLCLPHLQLFSSVFDVSNHHSTDH